MRTCSPTSASGRRDRHGDRAVGPQATLARVWKDYEVGVQVKVVRVARTTVHEVSHDEMIYVVDARGFERVVWPWPFTEAELIGSIHRLEA